MATSKKNDTPTFYEVVFRGKPKVVRAFLSGLVLGSCDGATVYYSFLDGVHHEGKAEKLPPKPDWRSTHTGRSGAPASRSSTTPMRGNTTRKSSP